MKNFVIAGILLFSVAAFSDIYDQGFSEAVRNHNLIISDFTNFQLSTRTQQALNAIVGAVNQTLAEQGYVQEAQALQREWDANFSQYFIGMFEIGDHEPLYAWLDQFYKKSSDRIGEPVMRLLHFDDLNTLNFCIPVVFNPKGARNGHDHWNQVEYQKHFVPFASIVTYWGSLTACKLVAIKVVPLGGWCSLISMVLRGAMKGTIAPRLSDFVFRKYAGKETPLELNFQDLDEYYQREALRLR